jgi:4-hydroxythreonine-4-phosphate dehydrogenase
MAVNPVNMSPARVAVTPGEPAGIGPDLCLQLAQQSLDAEMVVVANGKLLRERADMLGLHVTFIPFDPDQPAAAHVPGQIKLLDVALPQPVRCGTLDPAHASYVLETIRRATEHCLAGTLDGLVTGPVNKENINAAGIAFSGHTEYLAKLTNTPQVVMMLATEKLRVALATTHLPLKDVPAHITTSGLRRILEIIHHDLSQKFAIPRPRILVCGLNPHAGENGHLGDEELKIIEPAIHQARQAGLEVSGPYSADTVFIPRYLDHADVVLAMYHDQGLPVLKYAGFGNAINITLGLPIVRTSVDHGTALPLAGSGEADTTSLQLAFKLAARLANRPRARE